jgi:mercuric reductase
MSAADRPATLDITGMTCQACERRVSDALAGAGAVDVSADHRRGIARFRSPAGASEQTLRAAVSAAGYRAGELHMADPPATPGTPGGDRDFDLVVVGSGGAAFAAAIRATNLGARVALVERGRVGGTCVNVGCIPSKTLLAAADAHHRAARNPFAGVATGAGPVDLAALVSQKDELVAGLRQAKYLDLADDYGFEVIHGTARFAGRDSLEVDGRRWQAGGYVVATGAEPAVPDLPGLAEAGYLTSTTAMELTELPERLVVIGAGFVGLEQSQLFARLGTSVHLVGRLAPHGEPELAAWIARVFTDEGIVLHGARATAVHRTAGGVEVACADGSRCVGDAVLVATGRRARTEGLGLDAAGVERDERGFVVVDGTQLTTNPAVWAAGDVAGGPQFVYVAAAQGTLAADNAVSGAGREMDYVGLPSVTFTTPQLATAGMTEAQALAARYRCECRVVQLDQVPRALVNHDTRGAIKLVVDADTRTVLGVHALADGAGEMMLAGTYAIKHGLTVEDLADTWAPYLTMGEALKLAAQSFNADVKKLSCCAA